MLESTFDFVVLYIDPSVPFAPPSAHLDRDYVLICQLDFVTPYFVALKKKVVVVQMYDGSAGLPDVHWTYNRQASYINFSLHMHLRALKNGCRSILVKYFPDCERHKQVRDFTTKRAFFWERLPSSSINCGLVSSLLAGEVNTIHIHLSSDDRSRPSSDIPAMFGTEVTTSTWFEDRSDLEAVLDTCNIFVAPRIAEGIGHAFLEAMAKGMVVIAYDLPTHNEYIHNWRNGILFDTTTFKIDLGGWNGLAPQIGAAARASMQAGREEWLLKQKRLPAFMLETAASVMPDEPFFIDFAQQTIAEYQEGYESYSTKLKESLLAVQVFADWASIATPLKRYAVEEPTSRQGFSFMFGQSLHDDLLRSGWSVPEVGQVWAVERESSLVLKAKDLGVRNLRLVLEVRANQGKLLNVAVAGRALGSVQIGTEFRYYFIDGPLSLNGDTVTLDFAVDVLDTSAPDPRNFAFMLRSIRLVPDNFAFGVEQVVIVASVGQAESVPEALAG